MGPTISFENDKIFKSMKTGHFCSFWKGSNFKCRERKKVKIYDTLKWINRVCNFPAFGACKKRLS